VDGSLGRAPSILLVEPEWPLSAITGRSSLRVVWVCLVRIADLARAKIKGHLRP
jgi:hypothetical protein